MIKTLYALDPSRSAKPSIVPDEATTARLRFDSWCGSPRGGLVETFVAGRRHGWTMAFHGNGHKACEGAFVDGLESGWWVFWNEDGSAAYAVEFERSLPFTARSQAANEPRALAA